jgi:hypothetical protein
VKLTHILGHSVARKRSPKDVFSEDEVAANQDCLGEIENLLCLATPDATFREKLIRLIGDCRAFQSMWKEAPRRKIVNKELKTLQAAFRRRPKDIQEHLSILSPEGLFQLEAKGLTESTSSSNMKKIIQAAIKNVPKDIGGSAADQGLRFLSMQYGALYKEHTGLHPVPISGSPKNPESGIFLRSLFLVDKLTWPPDCYEIDTDEADEHEKRLSAIEDICKTLLYRKK